MAGLFDRYEDLRNNVPGAYQALLYCITHNVCISGRCIDWLIDEHSDLVCDEEYDDFDNASRWSIGKSYILALEGGFYRCWQEVGLTEMQPNEWYDQTFELVLQHERTIVEWITEEEAQVIHG